MKNKESLAIHKAYHKSRLIVLAVFLITVFSMTIGYSANLSSILNMLGSVNITYEEGNLEITSITKKASTNATDNGTTFSIKSGSTDDESILEAEFNIDFYRTGGGSTMSITYNIVIENNSLNTQTLTEMTSTPTFTSGSSTLNYAASGANIGTTVLKPGESVTVTLVFSLGANSRNTHYIVNEVYDFKFSTNSSTNLDFSAKLGTNSVTFNSNSDLAAVEVLIINPSSYDITYNFSSKNSNFEFVDSSGNELSTFISNAGVQEEITLYLKISSTHIFLNTTELIDLELNTTGPYILTYNLGNINATVPTSGSSTIIGNSTVTDDSSIDFTSTARTSGIYKNSTNGEITYFYRGNVTNNYVSFAGYTWRIIRIDKYGTRIILDSSIGSSAWASGNTANDLNSAINLLKYENSSVKSVLDSWYTSNLSSYSGIIKTSLFCEDFSYQSMTSSGSGYTTYYFGSYIRNGPDSSGYTPEFVCDAQYTFSSSIGLISGDEVSFAGGLFNNDNTNYYLYNSSISNYWWTISPSYYDTSLKTVGNMIVNGSNGRFLDWQNGSTIANSNAIRPVITLDTDRLSRGTGTRSNPYTFS